MNIPWNRTAPDWSIPAGDHVFRVFGIEHDEDRGAIAVHAVTAEGKRLTKTYYYLKKDKSEYNDYALNQFGRLAAACLPQSKTDSIDPNAIINCYFGAEVFKQINEYNGKSYDDVKNFYPTDGYEEGKVVSDKVLSMSQADIRPVLEATKKKLALERKAQRTQQTAPQSSMDLDEMLKNME